MKNLQKRFKILAGNSDILQKGDVLDSFIHKTLETIQKNDKENAEILIKKYTEFEFLLEPNNFYRGFFVALSHTLQLYFEFDAEDMEEKEKLFAVSLNHLREDYAGD